MVGEQRHQVLVAVPAQNVDLAVEFATALEPARVKRLDCNRPTSPLAAVDGTEATAAEDAGGGEVLSGSGNLSVSYGARWMRSLILQRCKV